MTRAANASWLRTAAVAHSLFPPGDLATAVERLGFVQADPLRAPATAQDLILRHRVAGYRVGDLDRWYPSAAVEEGVLYAHGFLPRRTWHLLRPADPAPDDFDAAVLAAVRRRGVVLPKDLDDEFGRAAAQNAWGSRSRATALALERLHGAGLLRIAGRHGLQRRYAVAHPDPEPATPERRLRDLVLAVVRVLAPATEARVRSIAARLRRRTPGVDHRAVIDDLCRAGLVERHAVDGTTWLWPADAPRVEEPPQAVRLLAPFDPLVWDRERFARLWGWEYRFEAYTPRAKRTRGHYALPMLYGDRVIGWANARVEADRLVLDVGFDGPAPKSPAFRRALDEERSRMEAFLERARPA